MIGLIFTLMLCTEPSTNTAFMAPVWAVPKRAPNRGLGFMVSGSRHQSQHGLLVSAETPPFVSIVGGKSATRASSGSTLLTMLWSSFQAPPAYWLGRTHFSPTIKVFEVPSGMPDPRVTMLSLA